MANTTKHNVNNNENNDANPPPTLEKVLIMQAQMLQTMQQTMVNMQQNQHAPQRDDGMQAQTRAPVLVGQHF
jgi:hypothetical protein